MISTLLKGLSGMAYTRQQEAQTRRSRESTVSAQVGIQPLELPPGEQPSVWSESSGVRHCHMTHTQRSVYLLQMHISIKSYSPQSDFCFLLHTGLYALMKTIQICMIFVKESKVISHHEGDTYILGTELGPARGTVDPLSPAILGCRAGLCTLRC